MDDIQPEIQCTAMCFESPFTRMISTPEIQCTANINRTDTVSATIYLEEYKHHQAFIVHKFLYLYIITKGVVIILQKFFGNWSE